jgi:hypothetical protein
VSAFGITAASTTVPLDATRTGVASFTVTNETGRPIRARAGVTVTGAPPPDPGWFTGPQPAERDLAIDGSDQLAVTIRVPDGVPGGEYRFRLDVVGVAVPDDDWAHGPEVAFTVPEPPPAPPPEPPPPGPVRRGYLQTVAGAALGALAGAAGTGVIGGLIVLVVGVLPSGAATLEDAIGEVVGLVILVVLLVALGFWLGAAVGAHLLLKAQGFEKPLQTSAPLAFLLPLWALLVLLLAARIADAADSDVAGLVLTLLSVVVIVVVPALVARLTYRLRTARAI